MGLLIPYYAQIVVIPSPVKECGITKIHKIHAFRLFFPAAAVLAGLTVPLSVWSVVSGTGWPPGLTGVGHGHELIFGFALALIAGYTLGPQPPRLLYPLFALWLAARVAWLMVPQSWLAQLLSPAFALILAWLVVPRFSAAKKWRNKITGPLILAICLIPLAWLMVPVAGPALPVFTSHTLMHFGVLCLLLLMTFMGGRIIAPAVAGTLEKKGVPLEARVQPRVEAALILLLVGGGIFVLSEPTRVLSGVCLILAAMLIVIRVVRWKLWRCPERPDLLAFGLGYLWLATGSAMTGAALILALAPAAALHLITVGALGTLSTSVMLRLYYQRAFRAFPGAVVVWSLTSLIAISALTRFLAGPTPFAEPALLWVSAISWSLAYLALAYHLVDITYRVR